MLLKLRKFWAWCCLLVLVMAPSQWQFAHADSKVSHHHSPATMDWVAQSGDTLNGLAHSFYPNQVAMQRLFVRHALRLNPYRHLTASTPLVNGESIVLPSLKALSYAERAQPQSSSHIAQTETAIAETTTNGLISPAHQRAYEQLLARNLKIQQQLAEVLDKQVRLQVKMNALMMSLQQQTDALKQAQSPIASPKADAGAAVPASEIKGTSTAESVSNSQSSVANTSSSPTAVKVVDTVSTSQITTEPPSANVEVVSAPAIDKAAEGNDKTAGAPLSAESKQAESTNNLESNLSPANQQADSETAEKTGAIATQANPINPPIKKSRVVIHPNKASQTSEANAYAQWFQFNSWSDILLWLGLLMLVLLMVGAGVVQLKKKLALREVSQVQSDWQPSVLELVNVNVDEPVAKKSRMDKRVQSLLSQVGILISANKESEAQVMLEKFIQLYPKQSVFPWLYLLELHRSNGQQEAFAHVVEHLHTTFNVEKADWKDEDTAMVVESQLDAFPHIILELERIWKTDEATQYLKDLQLDKRGGERQGFSLEVLKEIAVLQNVLEIRALQSQVA